MKSEVEVMPAAEERETGGEEEDVASLVPRPFCSSMLKATHCSRGCTPLEKRGRS